MDNSPKHRRMVVQARGPSHALGIDDALDRKLARIAWNARKRKRMREHNSKRAAELRAAIRRLNYKKQDTGGRT